MFNIFKSNKIENLMDALVSVLGDVPDNPMMAEWIGIQSRGMKQWIVMQMAQKFGICTNMHFVFPRQLVDQILADCALPEDIKTVEDNQVCLNEDLIFWHILKILHEHQSLKELSSVQDYIKEDKTGKKLFQLSMKIANVFDDYQVYRPEMLMGWQKDFQIHPSHEISKDPVAQWQAKFWKQIVSEVPSNHLTFKAKAFLENFSIKTVPRENLPFRISLFGISYLPRLFLQIFEKMSWIVEINLFLLTPSNQFFFDIKSAEQLGRIAIKQDKPVDSQALYHEMTNPLLSSLGTSAKGFHSCLEEFNYHESFDDLFEEPLKIPEELNQIDTMLSYLQSDILNLVHRKKGKQDVPVTISSSDRSICIHACHSPMRETQVLKDLLLDEFEKDSELAPHDIIVMMPDIETYAPFIESVFSLETYVPFSISDRKMRSESEPLDAFLKILSLRNSRLEQSRVLDLLTSESIGKKFKISSDEITMIEKMARDAKILWGQDSDHREGLGLPPFEENTWHFGLQRLFMGMAMPEDHDTQVQNILPCHSYEGLDLEVLGSFAAFCHTLFSALKTLTSPKPMGKWCETLKNISVALMDQNSKNSEDLTFLNQTIDKLKEDAQRAGFTEFISFEMIFSMIEQKLDLSISQGNFLAGNITFCNIMPMRSLPFKIVILMGMDEKSFPRQTFNPGFNLIKKYPERGDKIERDEDRYLFLETLLSVRLKLIITYTGFSIQDNSKIACAGVVNELMDTMNESFVLPKGMNYLFFHPLHPFNEVYFHAPDLNYGDLNQGHIFFSFSKDNCKIAKALRPDKSGTTISKTDEARVFIQPSFNKELKEPLTSISLDEMIRFFKKPVEYYVKQVLDIKIPDLEEQTLDREAFSISGLDQYSLGSFLVENNSNGNSISETDFYGFFKAMGSLPFGKKGRFEFDRVMNTAEPVIAAARNIALKKQLPPLATQINIDGLMVSGNFPDIRQDAVYLVTYGKLNGARLLSAWIRHLFLNVCASPGYPKKTILIGRDPKGNKPVVTGLFSELDSQALKYFKQLTQIFPQRRDHPFCFFCETSWQFVQAMAKENFELDGSMLDRDIVFTAMNRSKNFWYGGYYQTAEKDNRYVSLCVENNDPFENVDALISSGFVQNSITVYKPLLENLEIIS